MTPAALDVPRVLVDVETLEKLLAPYAAIGAAPVTRENITTQIALARKRRDRLEASIREGTLNAKIRVRTAIGVVVAEAWELRESGADLEMLEAFLRLRDRMNARPYAGAVVERCAPCEANPATDVWENVE